MRHGAARKFHFLAKKYVFSLNGLNPFQVTLVSVLFAARCGTVRHDTARCGMVRHSAPLSPDQNFSLLYSQRLVALYVGCRVYKLQVGTTVSGRLYLSLSHSFTGK